MPGLVEIGGIFAVLPEAQVRPIIVIVQVDSRESRLSHRFRLDVALFVFEMRKIACCFFPSQDGFLQQSLLGAFLHKFCYTLVDFMAAVLLQIAPDVAQQRDIHDRGDAEQDERADPDDHSKDHGDQYTGSD